MNGSLQGVKLLGGGVASALSPGLLDAVDVALCPPFVFLGAVGAELGQSAIALGAQNVSEFESGAYTGEIAASMLSESGCRYAVVGHSERRELFGETDKQVAAKFQAVLAAGMEPIVCVGERLEDRESGKTEAVVGRQLDAILSGGTVDRFAKAVVAYEPVWAIGTGETATPEQADAVHAFIRGRVAAASGEIASGLRILYGGSVKGANARGLFGMDNIDGGLIGGAALDVNEFVAICDAAGNPT